MVVRLCKAAGESGREESKRCDSVRSHCGLNLGPGWLLRNNFFNVAGIRRAKLYTVLISVYSNCIPAPGGDVK
jgi:hypothetical protein